MIRRSLMLSFLSLLIFGALFLGSCSEAKPEPPKTQYSTAPRQIEPTKECPLCGMFPARYPAFHCQIVYKDGSYQAFDSPAELMMFLLFPPKEYQKGPEVGAIYFKDYVNEVWIESEKTLFVVGSEVMSPMGIDFLPVDHSIAAKYLIDREKGRLMIPFNEVDRAFMLKAAKKGWLHKLVTDRILESQGVKLSKLTH